MAVILTLIFFFFYIGINFLIQRKKEEKQSFDTQAQTPLQFLNELIQNFKLHIPSGVFISKGHVWIRNLADGKIQVGLDDFCPGLLTKVDSIKLRKPGDRVNNEEGMCILFQGEKKLSFYSPFDGIIQEVNSHLLENPKILCIDPFNKGWIYKVKPSFETAYFLESDQLVNQALKWQKSERERLANFIREESALQEKLGQQLREGKLSLKGLLDSLNKLSWLKFERSFLK